MACPGDVTEEKNRLPKIIERLQRSADKAGFVLELKEWRQVIPGMGRPQQVIFDQIAPETWDIFIGILWTRFGSPSGAAHPATGLPLESGTHEEFLTAYNLWKEYQRPRILFYRCNRPPERLDQLDAEQLGKVKSFLAQFETHSTYRGFYKTYVTPEEFDHLVYDHVNELINDEPKALTLKRDTEKEILQRTGEHIKAELIPAKDLVMEAIEQIEQLYEHRGAVTGLSTGFIELDRMTNGLHSSEMIVIAAYPSVGKTALAMNIAEHVALDAGKAVSVFTLEMSSQQLMQRFLCSRAKVDLQKVRTGFLSARDFPNLTAAAAKLSTAKLYIDDTPGLDLVELRTKARQLKVQYDIDLIIIDYMQLLRSTSREAKDNRQIELSQLSADLKGLAKELGLPIIVVAQLKRGPREHNRPRLIDLRELGSIEQDADVIVLLERAEYYELDEKAKQERAGEAELTVVKQRNGPTGNLPLVFLKEFTRFENRSRDH